jgi:hypothetical protein
MRRADRHNSDAALIRQFAAAPASALMPPNQPVIIKLHSVDRMWTHANQGSVSSDPFTLPSNPRSGGQRQDEGTGDGEYLSHGFGASSFLPSPRYCSVGEERLQGTRNVFFMFVPGFVGLTVCFSWWAHLPTQRQGEIPRAKAQNI